MLINNIFSRIYPFHLVLVDAVHALLVLLPSGRKYSIVSHNFFGSYSTESPLILSSDFNFFMVVYRLILGRNYTST